MSMYRLHRVDESFFNPPRCVTTQHATGHCKRKEDLNTLLFRARRYKRSPFEEILRCSPPVARRHNRSMFEPNTHEIRADEADETDEERYTPVVIASMTAWYHQKRGVHAMTMANTDESIVNDPPNVGKSFFDGLANPHEKNFIFAVDASKSDSPQRQNPLNRRNQAVEAFEASQTNIFSNNNNNNNNNDCHQLHTIHATNDRKKNLCHRIDDSVFVKGVGR